ISYEHPRYLPSFPTRRSSDLSVAVWTRTSRACCRVPRRTGSGLMLATRTPEAGSASSSPPLAVHPDVAHGFDPSRDGFRELGGRSEEHTSELQSRVDLVCRLL